MRIIGGDPEGDRDVVRCRTVSDGDCAVEAQEKLGMTIVVGWEAKSNDVVESESGMVEWWYGIEITGLAESVGSIVI